MGGIQESRLGRCEKTGIKNRAEKHTEEYGRRRKEQKIRMAKEETIELNENERGNKVWRYEPC